MASERLTIAAVGDCTPARRISRRRDRPFQDLTELLQSADCTWGNCETVIADPQHARPAYKRGDLHLLSHPWAADELAAIGIGFLGLANNHTMDYGAEGLFSTLANLDRVGIAHAGAGRDLAEDARPGYCDCAAGRIAQVNFAATFPDHFAAGPAHPYVQGRPGLNPLRVQPIVQVDQDLFDRLVPLQEQFIAASGFAAYTEYVQEALSRLPSGVSIFERSLVTSGEGFDLLSIPSPEDLERILQTIAIARRNARLVLATLHAHQSRGDLELSAPFITAVAHACVDAGADVFFTTGQHVLRGIELYRGKPIFYSLSNFIFHCDSVPVIPAESWALLGLPWDSLDPSIYSARIPFSREPRSWQSVVPLITLESAAAEGVEECRLVSIHLHPISLGFGEPIWSRGTPRLAEGEQANAILEILSRLSAPFGTSLRVQDGLGIIDL